MARKRPVSDEEMVEIALARFRPLLDGPSNAPYTDLEERFGRHPNTLARAVHQAFKRGLVELRTRPFAFELTPVRHLERALCQSYPNLRRAIVINTGAKKTEVSARRWGDQVHMRLGYAVAQWISDGDVFRDDDLICMGSGRGAYSTVSAIQRPLALKNVTLVSMTGALVPEMHSEPSAGLDADFHVGLMGIRCREVSCKNVLYPIVVKDAESVREASILGSRRWGPKGILVKDDWKRPTWAIVGVGVLEGGHRFAVPDSPKILEPIQKDLKRLRELVASYSKEYPPYCPVADLCNRLFFLPPPSEIDIPNAERITALTEAINSQLLTASEDQLRQIKHLILVAGTERKALAIRYFLEKGNLNIRYLCTDAAAANLILDPSIRLGTP